MDPNATLKKIRELVKAADLDRVVYYEEASYMFELIENLDEWLTKGGFLPKDWANGKYSAACKD